MLDRLSCSHGACLSCYEAECCPSLHDVQSTAVVSHAAVESQ